MKKCFEYFNIFKSALLLNFEDLTYEYSSENFNKLSLGSAAIPRKGILTRLLSFLLQALRAARGLKKKRSIIHEKSILFFSLSGNEDKSLWPVCSIVPRGFMVGKLSENSNNINMFSAYLLSVFFLPIVFFNYSKSQGYKKESYKYIFDQYLLLYGLYIVSRLWLRKIKPMAIIISNHTHTFHRVIIEAAKKEGVPTVYIQHASVNENFPSLNMDYALLEGYDSLDKYSFSDEIKTKVFLVGMPKFDNYFHLINTRKRITSIGICTNGIDPIPAVESLCVNIIKKIAKVNVILRPHPTDRRFKEWENLAKKIGIQLSDPNNYNSFEFLKDIDVLIAGNSSIHLEAALIDVVPIYYDFINNKMDWYGYLRNGLVIYFSDPDTICGYLNKIIEEKPSVRKKTKRYCNNVDTKFDGMSSLLIKDLLLSLFSTNKFEGWRKIADRNMDCYEAIE